ncbi:Transposase [Dickeya dadantii 3937]|uniref:Transposase n=1 Tax=Dickeya dadantii (strain 3937) TaxID=198628 RepID=E0SDE9_DICD3|nr:Transposase [Dickeya dadantii 3937]
MVVLFAKALQGLCFLSIENPQLGWGFRKASSFGADIKTPFDLLKHLAVWQLQWSNKKSKGGPNGGRKELSAHPLEL